MAEITTTTYGPPTEIRSFARQDLYLALGGTLAAGENLVKGTVVGKITGTGLISTYHDIHNDGTEVAVGILQSAVDATLKNMPCSFYVMGFFVESLLTGLDNAAKADLFAQSLPDGSLKF